MNQKPLASTGLAVALALGTSLLGAGAARAAGTSETLVLPTAASVTGAYGQKFRTDLWIHNPAPIERRFVLHLRCWEDDPCATPVVPIIGPRQTRYLPDVLADMFGARERAGALVIEYDPAEGPLVPSARAVTVNGERPGNGTAIPVLSAKDARNTAAWYGLAGLGGDSGFRVNVGAYNPLSSPVWVAFGVKDASGNFVGDVYRLYMPGEWFQINDLLSVAGVQPENGLSVHVRSEGPVFPFAIAIDNRSADPTFLPAVESIELP